MTICMLLPTRCGLWLSLRLDPGAQPRPTLVSEAVALADRHKRCKGAAAEEGADAEEGGCWADDRGEEDEGELAARHLRDACSRYLIGKAGGFE